MCLKGSVRGMLGGCEVANGLIKEMCALCNKTCDDLNVNNQLMP